MADPRVEPEPHRLARDIGLGHVLERRVNGERNALDSRLGAQIGQRLERGDESGAAIGITRIIERIDPDVQVARPARLGAGQRQAEEHRVARRDIGRGNARLHSALGHRCRAGKRRSSERGEVERQDDMLVGQHRCDRLGRFQLDPVPLVIIDRQCNHAIARFARQSGADHRIEPARQQHHRSLGMSVIHRRDLMRSLHKKKGPPKRPQVGRLRP